MGMCLQINVLFLLRILWLLFVVFIVLPGLLHTAHGFVTLERQPHRVSKPLASGHLLLLLQLHPSLWKPGPDTYFHSGWLVTAWNHIANLRERGRQSKERESTSGCNAFWCPGFLPITDICCKDLYIHFSSSPFLFYIGEVHPYSRWVLVPAPLYFTMQKVVEYHFMVAGQVISTRVATEMTRLPRISQSFMLLKPLYS